MGGDRRDKAFGTVSCRHGSAVQAQQCQACMATRRKVCSSGHEMTPENTYWSYDGNYRACLTCRRNRSRAQHQRRYTKKAAA